MSVAGSSTFTDADGYQATLQDMLDLLVICPRKFNARLTWVELPEVQLLRAEESSARVAYLRLPREQAFVFFAIGPGPPLLHGGLQLPPLSLIWHNHRGLGHQRTTAASHWGSIALTSEALVRFGRRLVGKVIEPPAYPQIVRPAIADSRHLLRVHAQASRIAKISPNRIMHPEVVRALEQELMELLINCLAAGTVSGNDQVAERQARLCVQFEEMLGARPFRLLPTKEICEALGVSEQSFRTSCVRLLGMGPAHYQRLRRLKLVRTELRRVGRERPNVAEILARYGFPDLYRFVAEYWQAYGEVPPLPPREAPGSMR
jgi:AraC-like DNA-binding protein